MPNRRILRLPLRSESPSLTCVILRLPEIENGALLSLADNFGEYRIIGVPIKSIFETAVTSKNLLLKNCRICLMGEL